MKQRRNIDLTDIASLFLVVYYTWYCLPFMRATFQGGLYSIWQRTTMHVDKLVQLPD